MSKQVKLIEKLKSKPRDFTYEEMRKLLNNLGFYEDNKGKTSGSRVAFIKYNEPDKKIVFHKPHPENILKSYQIRDTIKQLIEWRLL